MLVVHNSPRDTENQTFEPTTTLHELPDNDLGGAECLAARFRMAGHYPHVLALADHAFRWAAKKDSEDLMIYVLENGAPVDIYALLHTADVGGNPKAIRHLNAKRAATEPLHAFIEPLHTACYYGQLDAVDRLLNNAPPGTIWNILHLKDYRGGTALHKAIGGRGETKGEERVELVYKLLILGAYPFQRDMHGRTPLLLARDSEEMIPVLKAAFKRMKYPASTLKEAFSELGIVETPADITLASSSDDEEVSSLKSEVSFEDETDRGSNKAEKVDGHKRSWWRSLLSPEAHSKPRKRMGTDRLSGNPSSRREDDLQKAKQERQIAEQEKQIVKLFRKYNPSVLQSDRTTTATYGGYHGSLE